MKGERRDETEHAQRGARRNRDQVWIAFCLRADGDFLNRSSLARQVDQTHLAARPKTYRPRRHQQQRTASTLDERLRAAVEAGVITPPVPGVQRSSVRDLPPVSLPGKPGSEMVIEDRR